MRWGKWLSLAPYKGPKRVGVFPPSPEDRNRSSFQKFIFSSFLNIWPWTNSKNPSVIHGQNPLEIQTVFFKLGCVGSSHHNTSKPKFSAEGSKTQTRNISRVSLQLSVDCLQQTQVVAEWKTLLCPTLQICQLVMCGIRKVRFCMFVSKKSAACELSRVRCLPSTPHYCWSCHPNHSFAPKNSQLKC
jgi:hypothetical protein